jgi:alginate O-acetyltransferase complex protein AlgI
MLFCSQQFLFFFTLVFTIYWAVPWHRVRVLILLAASFYFYASWNKWLACLICLSTLVDYLLARAMEHFSSPPLRRLMLSISIVGNLGLLCYFKYANFFLESLGQGLHAIGLSASLPVLQVILPVGISFYTFEAINYTVDVYRRKVRAERNLGNFMVFITFFPHLVAGPIVRARDFLPQLRRPKHWDWARMQLGVEYFLMGLFKKLVIADRMALFADPVFAEPGAFRTHTVWLAVVAYALQIYGDFSGYTDMAIGLAHMFGYKLAKNFNMPYSASSIAEFWHRWHISLSTWLRDYLFIPLGGSRGSRWQTCRNLMITMTLGGLWHGANWNFILWGVAHGFLLVAHRFFRDWSRDRTVVERALNSLPGTAASIGLTFLTVCFTWVLFRATSLEKIGAILKRMVVPTAGMGSPCQPALVLYTVLVVALCHWLSHQGWFKRTIVRVPSPVLGVSYACLFMVTLLLAPKDGQAFIYFQF